MKKLIDVSIGDIIRVNFSHHNNQVLVIDQKSYDQGTVVDIVPGDVSGFVIYMRIEKTVMKDKELPRHSWRINKVRDVNIFKWSVQYNECVKVISKERKKPIIKDIDKEYLQQTTWAK